MAPGFFFNVIANFWTIFPQFHRTVSFKNPVSAPKNPSKLITKLNSTLLDYSNLIAKLKL